MNSETIGAWAGLVWNALANADVLGLKQLKKITKLKDKEVFAAIGWLSREGKVAIQTNPDDEKDFLFSLTGDK
ncbi:MAG: winged helix-turn-helix domain-containing protein [Bacteroidales bacterium]|nr:winged helix-turn-helix domain-containing protein [Bacteroidales bacterium]